MSPTLGFSRTMYYTVVIKPIRKEVLYFNNAAAPNPSFAAGLIDQNYIYVYVPILWQKYSTSKRLWFENETKLAKKSESHTTNTHTHTQQNPHIHQAW
jgi:hypothetical protein